MEIGKRKENSIPIKYLGKNSDLFNREDRTVSLSTKSQP